MAKFHRFAALILIGGAGLTTCITFVWFSAPDLALTQLGVEIVTTVLLLLGLRWLPKRIEVAGSADGRLYALAIADTGPGIPPEAVGRIFEPFYRAPGARPGGAGIGLATVRRVMDAYGGAIAVESEVGRGTTFTVIDVGMVWTLPLSSIARARMVAAPS